MQINKWVTLIFGAICLMAVASAMGAQDLYYMAAILLTLPGVSYFFGWYALRGLIFERTAPPLLWAGEEAEIVCVVRNPSPTPRYFLSLQDSLPPGAERSEEPPLFNLGAGEASRIAQRLRFPRRGVFTSIAFEASAMDPLGIFSFSKKIADEEEWVVYPTPLPLPDAAAAGAERNGWQSVVRAAQRGGSVEPDGVRRYVTGDPLRRIHWRQTARIGALSVIEYEEAVAQNLLLVVDCNRDAIFGPEDASTLEIAIRAAASLAEAGLAAGCAVGLMAVGLPDAAENGLTLPSGRGEARLIPILNALARVDSYPRSPLHEVLLARAAEIPAGNTVIALTADADLRLAETLGGLTLRGIASFVIYVDALSFENGRGADPAARRDDFLAALLTSGGQAALLRRNAQGEASLETIENVAV